MVAPRCVLPLLLIALQQQVAALPQPACRDNDAGCMDYIRLGDRCAASEWLQSRCRATCGICNKTERDTAGPAVPPVAGPAGSPAVAPSGAEIPPAKDEMLIFMATQIFGENGFAANPQGIRREQIAEETTKNGGFVTCGEKKVKPRVTWETSDMANSDFWIFHCRDMPDGDEMARGGTFGKERKSWHLWVWYCEEHDSLDGWDGIFNLTMTMRLESDIPISYLNTDRDTMDALGNGWDTQQSFDMVPFSERTAPNPIAWAASNCGGNGEVANNRTGYVAALMQHIGVDSFGECLNNAKGFTERGEIMGSDKIKGEAKFLRKYKFYLAFENANCRGYVSEKLPKTYLWNLVPIIGGPPDGIRHTPTSGNPPSAIHVQDFANAEALAKFVKKVAADEQLYNAYHSWRSDPQRLISKEYRELFPPQSKRPHDICKFVKVWHHATTQNKVAALFEPCVDPGSRTGWF